ncbi:MAG: DUF72 domain-containing protein [candidate division Zixibacteria bacterium]|nr:DUF72 domain-containing protein [candidate division Zixibacteria bacterium]
MDICIGTSGYSFKDWRGRFYPSGIASGKMLDHYVKFFQTVEINSTYYHVPHPSIIANIARKAPEEFDFIVKTPQSFTHRRNDIKSDLASYREALKPLDEIGKLSGVLAQFPFSFKFNSTALDYVCAIRKKLEPHQLFVEFRHRGWVNRTMYDRLRNEGIGYVCVDEPSLPGLLAPDCFATTNTAYIRLHGRNDEQWWNGGPLRYDYNYSGEELESWHQKIKKLKSKGSVDKVFMFFNNCHQGHAVDNALNMKQLLNV